MNLTTGMPDIPFRRRQGGRARRAPFTFWGGPLAWLRPVRRTISLPPDPSSASVARTFVRKVLSEWDLTVMEPDACLVATELVTNGLRHGGGAESLTLTANNRHLQIAVSDKAALRSPRRLYRELTAEGGRGIALVEALADTWGTTRPRTHRGKAVWCKLKI
jgi:anti-sigma regulatory factor (Ser/Thr protein kinase)